ncbi:MULTISPECIES: tRNA adenosine deaminase-associated protein [unclassified Streptomyces]|uniref:tRNA adenosine deaminase-associated protein n=1 Tax=unclassified Streptomyces TaxID=2593676 RepID=UPI0036CE7378
MYFAALLARTEDGWEASDTELDDVEALSDLTDLAREALAGGAEDDTVLVFIEQEDAWFGVLRVDGEEDPRIYVSDAAAAARSSYGEILLTDELLGKDPDQDELDALDLDGTEDGEPDPADEDETGDDDAAGATAEAVPPGPIGDRLILADLGVSEKELLALDPNDALSEIAEVLGAAEVLETVR